jgi:hypothetical protein
MPTPALSEWGPEAAGPGTEAERTPFAPARWFGGGRFDFHLFHGRAVASEMGSILSAPERKHSGLVGHGVRCTGLFVMRPHSNNLHCL